MSSEETGESSEIFYLQVFILIHIYIFTYLFNSLVHVFFPGRLGYDRFTPAKLYIVWVKLLWPGFGVVQWSYSCEFSSSKLSSVGPCHLKQVGLHVNGWSQLNMREVKVDNMSNASPRPQVPIQHMKMQMGQVTACMWKREAKGNKSSCRSAVHNNPRPETTMKKWKNISLNKGLHRLHWACALFCVHVLREWKSEANRWHSFSIWDILGSLASQPSLQGRLDLPSPSIHSTDYGFPWRHPITDDSESWTQPAANHASPNTPPWDWSYFRFTQWTPQSNFHDGTTHRPNFQNFSPSRTSPGHDQDHYPCHCSIQAMGLIDWGPTTEKETKIRFSPRSTYSCYWTTWPSRPASRRLRSTSWRPQLRWFWLWCSVGSRSHTWSLRHRHQLSLPSIIHHHFHNTTWHFHSYTDAESKGTTTINYSAKPSRPSSWSAIPSMDQYRWSRAD